MNWNSYDTKYIIKRLIIGFGMLILFSILTTKKASAMTVQTGSFGNTNWSIATHMEDVLPIGTNSNRLDNVGKGTIYFSLLYYNTNGEAYFNSIYAVGIDTGNQTYQCDIGNQVAYNDEGNKKNTLISVVCPVDFSNTGLRGIRIKRAIGTQSTSILLSSYFTFFNEEPSGQSTAQQTTAINNAISSQTQQLLDRLYNNQVDNQQLTQQIIANQNANQAQAHQDAQQIHNDITNDNVDGAKTDMDDFSNNSAFSDSSGLQAVIELPLNLVNSFTNTCQPINITIPWLDYTGTIPCMSTIYRSHFNNLYNVVKLIVNAFFLYRILLKIYELVHEAKQPDEDKLEVIEL